MSDNDAALLVVDDIEDNRFALSRRLARQGYLNVTTAADGRQALELLNSRPFDLVLLDIMMPNVNGYEVLAAMKADERLRHIPVIMISAVDEIESVIRCIELGAEDYLPKPFNPTLLRARVGASLERKRLHDQVTARTRELTEALEQQTATSQVLSVISSSPGELEPVFQAILENATRISEAAFGTILLREGDGFRRVALHNAPRAYVEYSKSAPLLGRTKTLAHLLETMQAAQVADMAVVEPESSITRFGGARTLLNVPLIKEDELIGVIGIYRQEVRPFTEKQIELVSNFAKQAVIAIENTRLLNELRESLQQQTATADVLKVISRSTFDLQTVLDTLIESAVRLCEADMGSINRQQGDVYRQVANFGHSPELDKFMGTHALEISRGTVVGRTVLEGRTVHIVDVQADPQFTFLEAARIGGLHTMLGIPLLREGTPIGVIVLQRKSVQPFTEKQIELATTFADQAVIAIENVRLFDEVQARTRELTEALERQTATSEVLQVISGSPGTLEPVFETMLANATRICEAVFGSMLLVEGDEFRRVALHNAPREFAEFSEKTPRLAASNFAHTINAMRAVQIADMAAESPDAPIAKYGGARTLVTVPMLKQDKLIGVIGIYRQEVRPFTDKQVELVSNFAKQAVIAIENTRLLNELRESLQQQTATAEVLQVISASPGELEPVFDALLKNAVRLCASNFGNLYLREGELFRLAAWHNTPPDFVERRRSERYHPGPNSPPGHMLRTRSVVHVADLLTDASYAERDPGVVAGVELAGIRTIVIVPMLKEGEPIGYLSLYRQEVQPFSDKQIELLENFAAQAVIAIENTRLLNELREALQQQTATADVLRVISSSPGELKPVFEAMLANATCICEAKYGVLFRYDEGSFYPAATLNPPPALADFLQQRGRFLPAAGTALDSAIKTKKVIHIEDDAAREVPTAPARFGGARSYIAVPMLKENEVVGAIVIYRQEVRPFTEKQVELVTNFAAQAVIAIENTRLLNELRESLQQQTATSEVLQVISSSPGELEPVFQAMLANATRLCEAKFGAMYLNEGSAFRIVAMHNVTPAFAELRRRNPVFRSNPRTALARAAATKQTVQIADVQAEPGYFDQLPGFSSSQIAMLEGTRTVLAVPMLKESELVGVIAIYRQEVSPFTEKQVGLVQNFGSQAVIAIENTRLLNELRESLQQQTATADVLKVISRSTFDLKSVLQTLVESAGRLCGADYATISRQKDGVLFFAEAYGYSSEFIEYVKAMPVERGRGTATGRALLEGRVIHIADVLADPDYTWAEAQRLGGYRTVLGVPMLREGIPTGVLTLTRSEVRPFSEKQIELVSTFADQAAIAIENVRLFDEIQDKSKQLTEASERKSQFLASMSHELRTPLTPSSA
jgi:GAF domain-containing protein/CheY-like chemotaxis protein